MTFKLKLSLLACVLALAACSDNGDKSSTPDQKTTTEQSSSTVQKDANDQAKEASSSDQTIKISTARGEVDVPVNPQPLVVLDLAVLDDLQALDVPVAGVPGKIYLKTVAEKAKDSKVIGTLFEPDYEAINRIQPKLIVIASRSATKYDELSKIAPTIDVTPQGYDVVTEGLKNLDTYGRLFNKEDKAKALHQEVDQLLKETQEAVKGKGNALFVMVNGGKLSTFGHKSRFGWIHTALGIPEADPNIKEATHGQPISFEFIQKTNPDWLIVFDRTTSLDAGGQTAQVVLDNDLVHQSKAWKNHHIIYLSAWSYLAAGSVDHLKTDLTTIKDAFSK